MDYRTLDVTLISARGLKKRSTLFGKSDSDVYAVAYIHGSGSIQKLRTPVHKNGGSNPTWNFPMKFTVDYAAVLQKRVEIVVKIKAVGMFIDKKLGEVRGQFAFSETVQNDVSAEGKGQTIANYQLTTPSGKPKGCVSFSYRFSGKFSGNREENLTAVGSSSMYVPKDLYHQPQPTAVQQHPKKKKHDKGSGAGGLFGFLMMDSANGGGGHRDGGGGHGGGCGGGGCGGEWTEVAVAVAEAVLDVTVLVLGFCE